MHALIVYPAQCGHLEDLVNSVNSEICNSGMEILTQRPRLARGLWEAMAFGAPREPCAGVDLDL